MANHALFVSGCYRNEPAATEALGIWLHLTEHTHEALEHEHEHVPDVGRFNRLPSTVIATSTSR